MEGEQKSRSHRVIDKVGDTQSTYTDNV